MKKEENETLIEKAKKIKIFPQNISNEEIQLALAWLKSEITSGQACKALNSDTKIQGYNKIYRIAICLREAFNKGLLILKDKN